MGGLGQVVQLGDDLLPQHLILQQGHCEFGRNRRHMFGDLRVLVHNIVGVHLVSCFCAHLLGQQVGQGWIKLLDDLVEDAEHFREYLIQASLDVDPEGLHICRQLVQHSLQALGLLVLQGSE